MLDKISELIRAVVRPIVTVIAVVSTIFMIFIGTTIPTEWWPLLGVIITFWFATRKPSSG